METEFCLRERYLWVWKKVSTDFGGRQRQCYKKIHIKIVKFVHNWACKLASILLDKIDKKV